MSERITKLTEQLNTSRARLNAVLAQIGERADEQLYSDGAQWTLRQLAIHLAIADQGLSNIAMQAAEGNQIVPEDYDIERFNQRSVEKRAEMPLSEAIANLAATRTGFLQWLAALDENKLDLETRHPIQVMMPLERFIALMAEHEDGHCADMEAYLRA